MRKRNTGSPPDLDFNPLPTRFNLTEFLLTSMHSEKRTSKHGISIVMKGTEVPNPRRSSALVSCSDYFSPSRSEKYGLGMRLAVHVIVLVC